VHFSAGCFTQEFYEKSTKKYLKAGAVPTIRKKTSASISERDRHGERIFNCRLASSHT